MTSTAVEKTQAPDEITRILSEWYRNCIGIQFFRQAQPFRNNIIPTPRRTVQYFFKKLGTLRRYICGR